MTADSSFGPPKSADDWMRIADRELDDLKGCYTGGLSNEAKVQHAISATEAVLKAVFWKHRKLTEWPPNRDTYKFLYKHNLDAFLDRCGLRTQLHDDKELWNSWRVLLSASAASGRYSPHRASDEYANQVARSVRHPDVGIVTWLKKIYATLT